MMARASNNMEKKKENKSTMNGNQIACKHMFNIAPLNGKSIEITNVQVDW